MKTPVISIVLALIVVASFLVYWFVIRGGAPVVPSAPDEAIAPPVGEVIDKPSLGSELFEKAVNPIKGAVPEPATIAPVTNPLQGAYVNPFE